MKQNKTVVRTFEILNIISQHKDGITFSEIMHEVDIPKSTVHDILSTLYSIDAIYYKEDRIKNYVIGSKLFSLGSTYSSTSQLINQSKPYIEVLSIKLQKTMMITKFLDDEVFCVYSEQPNNSLIAAPRLGTMYGEDGVRNLFEDVMKSQKKNKCIDCGYRIEGLDENVIKISIVIMNFENKVCGCITTIGINEGNEYKSELNQLIHAANDISNRLGFKYQYQSYFISEKLLND